LDEDLFVADSTAVISICSTAVFGVFAFFAEDFRPTDFSDFGDGAITSGDSAAGCDEDLRFDGGVAISLVVRPAADSDRERCVAESKMAAGVLPASAAMDRALDADLPEVLGPSPLPRFPGDLLATTSTITTFSESPVSIPENFSSADNDMDRFPPDFPFLPELTGIGALAGEGDFAAGITRGVLPRGVLVKLLPLATGVISMELSTAGVLTTTGDLPDLGLLERDAGDFDVVA